MLPYVTIGLSVFPKKACPRAGGGGDPVIKEFTNSPVFFPYISEESLFFCFIIRAFLKTFIQNICSFLNKTSKFKPDRY